ncbi:MAG: LacI family DNA-binding transcriptional regulator [Acidobacteria bacterium]|nr:LacI family DNA-binding transcriptional regulator [Acidobacteriota bacterium]
MSTALNRPAARPTQQLVARLADTSQAVVSQVLRGDTRRRVANETRQRVLKVAQQVGYFEAASLGARRVIAERTGTIGLLVVGMSPEAFGRHHFYHELLVGVDQELQVHGKQLIFSCMEKVNAHHLAELYRKVDGVLLKDNRATGLIQEVAAKKPMVLFDCVAHGTNVSQVSDDEYEGKFAVTSYLIQQGHRSIAYLLRDGKPANPKFQLAYQSYLAAMARHGLEVPASYQSLPTLRELADKREKDSLWDVILKLDPRPTALVCFEDYLALSLIDEARQRGIRIPDEFSITGYNDIPQASVATPALTTMAPPWAEIGARALKVLLREIEDPSRAKETIRVQPKLVERASVKRLTTNGTA